MRWLLFSVALLLPDYAIADGGFGYVRATSQLGKDSPMNLLDGRIASVWCEGAKGDGVGERVVVGFKEPVVVDEVRFVNGDTRGRKNFASRNRPQKISLTDGKSRHEIALADKGQEQAIRLEPPLKADRLELEILAVFPGDEGESACLAEVALYSQGHLLVSKRDVTHSLNESTLALVGRWYAGPRAARDRFLDFYTDGTFRYLHQPFDPEEPVKEVRGSYSMDPKGLKVLSNGATWVSLEAKNSVETASDGTLRTLLTISASLEEDLAGLWADTP